MDLQWLIDHYSNVPVYVILGIIILKCWPTIDKVVDWMISFLKPKKKKATELREGTNGKKHKFEETGIFCPMHDEMVETLSGMAKSSIKHHEEQERWVGRIHERIDSVHDRIDGLYKLKG